MNKKQTATESEIIDLEPTPLQARRPKVPTLSLTANEEGLVQAGMDATQAQFDVLMGGVQREFVDQALHELLNIALTSRQLPAGPVPAGPLNAMLQAANSIQPADEVEAMLGLQMAAFHHVTMDCLRRAVSSSATLEGRALNLGQANKCSRTFATLLETLNRHRGKTTTQRVIVENVTVQSGGQAVVGAVAGVGRGRNGKGQAHEQSDAENHGGGEGFTALPCPQSIGESLSASGDEGEGALQSPRRSARKRSAAGKPQRAEARSLQRGGGRGAPNGSGASTDGARVHVNVTKGK